MASNLPSISLCMIVKDEAENIRLCLDSVKGVVDEIIIVDTGSKDKTIDICREYTDKIYHFDWIDDFSAARNESIKYATKDWILVLDADEVLTTGSASQIKKYLSKINIENNVLGARIYEMSKMDICNNYKMNMKSFHPVPRIIRNHVGIAYKYSLHELPQKDKYDSLKSTIKIFHYGYSQSSKERAQRAIKCLLRDLEKYPEDNFIKFNLARTYSLLGEKDKIIALMDEVILKINQSRALIESLSLVEVYQTYIKILLNNEYYEKAISVSFSWLSRLKNKKDLRPYVYLMKAYVYLKRNTDARTIMSVLDKTLVTNLRAVPIQDRGDVERDVFLFSGYLLLLDGKFNEALAKFERTLEVTGHSPDLDALILQAKAGLGINSQ